MALCLGKNIRSCSSFVFVGRRSQHTNCFDQKLTTAMTPILKEINGYDYLSPAVSVSSSQCLSQKVALKGSLPDILQWKIACCNLDIKDTKFCWNFIDNCINNAEARVLCVKEKKEIENKKQIESDEIPGKPDRDQLNYVFNVLTEDLPNFFVKSLNYSIYHRNVIFENNIKGIKTRGILSYYKELAIIKILGHVKYAGLSFTILKITAHPEDGTIRVRWRISGVSNYKAFFYIFKSLSLKKIQEPDGWYDGFSIFYVKSDGLVHRHTVDKMIPDSEEKIPKFRNKIAAKMAFAVGIIIEDLLVTFLLPKKIFFKQPNSLNFINESQQLEVFSKHINASVFGAKNES